MLSDLIFYILLISTLLLTVSLVILITERYWHANYLCRLCYENNIDTWITEYEYYKNNGMCGKH